MATFINGESLSSVRTKINDAIDKVDGNAAFSNDISVTGNITVTGTVDGVDIAARDSVLTTTTTTANAALPLAGGTLTGTLNFGDNVKAQFGASADLQVFHDGTNSYIQDAGTGNLFVQASNVLWLRDASGTAYFSGTSGNEVTLYHNGSEKLATTTSGIDVTGKIQVLGGGASIFDNFINVKDDTNDTRISFERSDTGASGWIGIPSWDADALKIYGPTASGNEAAANYTNQSWSLYGGGSVRLATTTSGIDVTGTVVADGLTMGGDHKIVFGSDTTGLYRTNTGNDLSLQHWGNVSVLIDSDNNDTSRSFFVGANSQDLSTAKFVARFEEDGDISFYEDTGTTAKFFWDASTERLGIGTASPSTRLDVVGEIRSSGTTAGNGGKLTLGNDDFGTYEWITQQDYSTGEYVVTVTGTGGAEFKVGTDGSDYTTAYAKIGNGITLDSSGSSYFTGGNVGIGTSSPSAELHVNDSSGASQIKITGGGTSQAQLSMTAGGGTESGIFVSSLNDMRFNTNGTEAIRIDSSGNLQMTAGGAVDFGNWTITESGGSLYFATGGTNKMKLDASGNLDVVGSVNANATIT